jgi:FeS assembly protein IscX
MSVNTLRWTDSRAIAEALAEAHPQVDARTIRYTDLHRWVCALEVFGDNPERSNEKILEAIQMAWIDEM